MSEGGANKRVAELEAEQERRFDISKGIIEECEHLRERVAELEEQMETQQGLRGVLERAKQAEDDRDVAQAEVKRLREWLAERTAIVGTMFACEAIVSDTCIANRGPDGAASEACRRLRLAFGALLSGATYQEGRKYRFALVVEAPKGGA